MAIEDNSIQFVQVCDWMENGELILGSEAIQKCFLFSKMPVVDEYSVTGNRYTTMQYVEFLEFLVRISELDFYNSEEDELSLKLTNSLLRIL